jgi:hypothetical protein
MLGSVHCRQLNNWVGDKQGMQFCLQVSSMRLALSNYFRHTTFFGKAPLRSGCFNLVGQPGWEDLCCLQSLPVLKLGCCITMKQIYGWTWTWLLGSIKFRLSHRLTFENPQDTNFHLRKLKTGGLA